MVWNRIVHELNAIGVPCYQGSCSEIYLEKAFENTPWRPINRLKNAMRLGETSLMFLVHPTITSNEIEKCCVGIKKIFSMASQ